MIYLDIITAKQAPAEYYQYQQPCTVNLQWVFVTLFAGWKIRLHRLQITTLDILIKKERLKRFNRFKEQHMRKEYAFQLNKTILPRPAWCHLCCLYSPRGLRRPPAVLTRSGKGLRLPKSSPSRTFIPCKQTNSAIHNHLLSSVSSNHRHLK